MWTRVLLIESFTGRGLDTLVDSQAAPFPAWPVTLMDTFPFSVKLLYPVTIQSVRSVPSNRLYGNLVEIVKYE